MISELLPSTPVGLRKYCFSSDSIVFITQPKQLRSSLEMLFEYGLCEKFSTRFPIKCKNSSKHLFVGAEIQQCLIKTRINYIFSR